MADIPGIAEPLDGRVARRERNRDAVVDAIMVLVQSGEIDPSIAQVAEVAGVSERSIFRHFESREALVAAVIERQLEVVSPLLREIPVRGPVEHRVRALVNERARLFEEITPMRYCALRVADRSELVADQLAAARSWLREELRTVFARELERRPPTEARDVLDALDLVTSWEAWNVLRARQACSVARARRLTERLALHTLRA
ncbi:MAG TPA: TetR/AcrR family transcriptional regulator [Acidimicrobiales bacterium]|nr:TetR/AcrR family transcriptional regulator [Acidimicrobiales bacterium]